MGGCIIKKNNDKIIKKKEKNNHINNINHNYPYSLNENISSSYLENNIRSIFPPFYPEDISIILNITETKSEDCEINNDSFMELLELID